MPLLWLISGPISKLTVLPIILHNRPPLTMIPTLRGLMNIVSTLLGEFQRPPSTISIFLKLLIFSTAHWKRVPKEPAKVTEGAMSISCKHIKPIKEEQLLGFEQWRLHENTFNSQCELSEKDRFSNRIVVACLMKVLWFSSSAEVSVG